MSEVPAAPQPVPVVAATKPGRGLGIAGIILAIVPFTQVIGLILSIIGLVISRKAGFKNAPALAGIIVSIVLIIVYIVVIVAVVTAGVAAFNQYCSESGSGTFTDGTTTYTCP